MTLKSQHHLTLLSLQTHPAPFTQTRWLPVNFSTAQSTTLSSCYTVLFPLTAALFLVNAYFSLKPQPKHSLGKYSLTYRTVFLC